MNEYKVKYPEGDTKIYMNYLCGVGLELHR